MGGPEEGEARYRPVPVGARLAMGGQGSRWSLSLGEGEEGEGGRDSLHASSKSTGTSFVT